MGCSRVPMEKTIETTFVKHNWVFSIFSPLDGSLKSCPAREGNPEQFYFVFFLAQLTGTKPFPVLRISIVWALSLSRLFSRINVQKVNDPHGSSWHVRSFQFLSSLSLPISLRPSFHHLPSPSSSLSHIWYILQNLAIMGIDHWFLHHGTSYRRNAATHFITKGI